MPGFFGQAPSRRHAPSPGPGWTTLPVEESDSEEDEDKEEDMLNDGSSSSTPIWGSQSNSKTGIPRPVFRGRPSASTQPVRAGPSSNQPSQARVLANTLNAMGNTQPGKQNAHRTRYPGELKPWKARTLTQSDASRMPPPTFSASQLVKAKSSGSSSSQPAASISAASASATSTFPSTSKPYVGKETARKTTNSLSASQRLPQTASSTAGPSGSQRIASLDKGKGRAREDSTSGPSRPGSANSVSEPASPTLSRIAIAASGKSPKSKARSNRPATSSDAAQLVALTQVSRAAKKASVMNKEKSRSPSPPRKGFVFPKKKGEGSKYIFPKNVKPLKPPPSTQPVRVKPDSSRGMASISAPLPSTQPASSRGARAEGGVIVLSGSSDDERAAKYMKKLEKRRRDSVAARRSQSSQRSGTPELIDLTIDDINTPSPPKPAARKSTVPNLPARNVKPKPAPAPSQKHSRPGPVIVGGVIDLTLDDSPPRPKRASQVTMPEPVPSSSMVLDSPISLQPPPRNDTQVPPEGPIRRPKPRQTARKTTGRSPSLSHSPPPNQELSPTLGPLQIVTGRTPSPLDNPPPHEEPSPPLRPRPRQTARKSTGRTPSPSDGIPFHEEYSPPPKPRQTARKSTGRTPSPSSSLSPHEEVTPHVEPRQTARKTTGRSPSPPNSLLFTPQPTEESHIVSPNSRQTARKSTQSVRQTSPLSRSTARKTTGPAPSPTTSRRMPRMMTPQPSTSSEQVASPRQTARKSTRSHPPNSASSPSQASVLEGPFRTSSIAKIAESATDRGDDEDMTDVEQTAAPETNEQFTETPFSDDVGFDEPVPMDVSYVDDDFAPSMLDGADLEAKNMEKEDQSSEVAVRHGMKASGPPESKGTPRRSHLDREEVSESPESEPAQLTDDTDSDNMTMDDDAEEVDALISTSISRSSSRLSVMAPMTDKTTSDGEERKGTDQSAAADADTVLRTLPASLSRNLSINSPIQTPEPEEAEASSSMLGGPLQDHELSVMDDDFPHSQETVKLSPKPTKSSFEATQASQDNEGRNLVLSNSSTRESTAPPTYDTVEDSSRLPSSAPGPPDSSLEQSPVPMPKTPPRTESQAPQSQGHQLGKSTPHSLPQSRFSSLSDAIQFAGLKNSQTGPQLLKERPDLSLRRQAASSNAGSPSLLRNKVTNVDARKPILTPLSMLKRREEASSQTSSRHSSVDIPIASGSTNLGSSKMRDTSTILKGTSSRLSSVTSAIAQSSSPLKRFRSSSASESESVQRGRQSTIQTPLRNASKRPRKISPPAQSSATSRSSSSDSRDVTNRLDDQNLARDKEVGAVDRVFVEGVDIHPPGVLTQASQVKGREYAPAHRRAGDIPHELANAVNNIPAWYVNGATIRQAFEAAMVTNTTNDEPDAPYIRVINEVDDEPTPPFEFFYSNLMWHGDKVSEPDFRNLKGCGCIGRCDPKDPNCSCLARAKPWRERAEIKGGFMYDTKGRLKAHNFPIYECNDLCGCDDDCYNRVVQQGRQCIVNIVKTPNKGWGIFAGKRIPSGTFVGIYAGEIITDEEGERRGRIYEKYTGRTYLFDIDFWHIHENEENDMNYVVDAFHAGNFTRFLNHSCDPNCRINAVYINEANKFKPLMVIFTCRDISAGEELCFSYFGDPDEEDETADVHDSPGKSAHMHEKEPQSEKKGERGRKCECGAPNCRGKLFQ